MSVVMGGIDEGLWELYLNWCEQHNIKPKVKGYLIWLEEQGYNDEPLFDEEYRAI